MNRSRSVLFVDGNNWYHGLKRAGVIPNEIELLKVAQKLVGPARELTGLRYYVGEVKGTHHLATRQQAFLDRLRASDPRVSLHLGRIEDRSERDETAVELLQFLASLTVRIDSQVYHDLMELGKRRKQAIFKVEKAVDVMLAVDLVSMAHRDEFDTAYLLSADGDFTHASSEVRALGKKIFAASAAHGNQLGAVVDKYLHLKPSWFDDCKKQ